MLYADNSALPSAKPGFIKNAGIKFNRHNYYDFYRAAGTGRPGAG